MIPGLTSKLSEQLVNAATVVYQQADIMNIVDTTATTALETIIPAFGGGFSGFLTIVNTSGNAVTAVATGNIATTLSIANGKCMSLVYCKSTKKYYPQA